MKVRVMQYKCRETAINIQVPLLLLRCNTKHGMNAAARLLGGDEEVCVHFVGN